MQDLSGIGAGGSKGAGRRTRGWRCGVSPRKRVLLSTIALLWVAFLACSQDESAKQAADAGAADAGRSGVGAEGAGVTAPVAESGVRGERGPRFRDFRIQAHRCAAGHAPENTLAACRRSLARGHEDVEVDVQLSRDGHVVLFHDQRLEKKLGRATRVRDHDLAALETMDLAPWFRRAHPEVAESFTDTTLTTLDGLFEAFGARLRYQVELKTNDAGLAQAIAASVARSGITRGIEVSSFLPEQLASMREVAPRLPRTFLVERGADVAKALEKAKALGCVAVSIAVDELTREAVDAGHAAGLAVRAWGVRADEHVLHALETGADGLTTDWPERAEAMRERYFEGARADHR